jgi:hypothetical protein
MEPYDIEHQYNGGREGTRTLGLLNANQTLSRLSYTPFIYVYFNTLALNIPYLNSRLTVYHLYACL